MNDQIFTPTMVNGMEFSYVWQDFGNYVKLNIFQRNKLLGSKKFPIKTDRGIRVIKWAIKSILRTKQDGKTINN